MDQSADVRATEHTPFASNVANLSTAQTRMHDHAKQRTRLLLQSASCGPCAEGNADGGPGAGCKLRQVAAEVRRLARAWVVKSIKVHVAVYDSRRLAHAEVQICVYRARHAAALQHMCVAWLHEHAHVAQHLRSVADASLERMRAYLCCLADSRRMCKKFQDERSGNSGQRVPVDPTNRMG